MIEIRNLSLRLGSFSLKDINLTIGDGEYFVILGPTGAGKTVLIECLAGLHRISKGEIWIDGKNATRLAPEERGIGYTPQDYVLFPFLNVFDNVGFGLRQAGYSRTNIAEEIADRMGILNMGRLEQVGDPQEVFFYPENEIVADFVGAPTVLDCDHRRNLGQGLMEVNCGGLNIILPHDGNMAKRIAIFPRDIYISAIKPPGPPVNRFEGIITGIKSSNATVRIRVKAGENALLAEMPPHIFQDTDLAVGKKVFLILKLRRIRIYEDKDL
jgi:ABC-type sugar transport system ATPase subunit